MASACALAMFSGKNILNFAFVALCGALQTLFSREGSVSYTHLIDDKLIKKGQEEGTSMKEVVQRFEAEYLKDAAGLNCEKPTVQPAPWPPWPKWCLRLSSTVPLKSCPCCSLLLAQMCIRDRW